MHRPAAMAGLSRGSVEITSGAVAQATGCVTGRLRLDQAALLSLDVVAGFAEHLAGAGLDLPPARKVQETACQIGLFARRDTRELVGEATRLRGGETGATWQVAVRDDTGEVVATVTLTFFLREATGTAIPDGKERPENPEPAEPPPSPASPTKSGEKRREQIAAAASDVIARKGFANATMREIADAAGLHVPTMYQYVSSKDEMLELVYYWTMASLRTDVAEATRGCATAREKLQATILSLMDKGDRYRQRVGVLNRELRSLSPAARERVLAQYRVLLRQIADLVEEGISAGEFRLVEPEIAANVVEAVCDIWALRQFAVGRFGRAAFQNQILELLLAGLSR